MFMNDLKIELLRWVVWVYRFHTLQIVKWYFNSKKPAKLINIKLFGGFLNLNVQRTDTHKLLCVQRERFIEERTLIKKLIKKGETAIDVGANIGYYLLMINEYVGNSGTIVCIEPEPTNFNELGKCISENQLLNVTTLPCAVGNENSSISILEGMNGRVGTSQSVGAITKMLTLDSLANYKPAFIKIDIEGFEGQAVIGMEETMRILKPNLFIEVHPAMLHYGVSEQEIVERIKRHYSDVKFYSLNRETGIHKIIHRYIPRPLRSFNTFKELKNYYFENGLVDPYWLVATR